MNENKGKAIITEEKPKVVPPKKNNDARGKLLKMMVFISIGLVVLFVLILLITLIKGTNLSYEQIEGKLENAAVEYYKVQSVLLPEKEGETTEVDSTTLASEDYKLMKPLSKLKKNVSCTGKVVVQKVDGKYVYTPYLDCGTSYTTKELYKAVLEQGVVTAGSGLYEMNGEHVFRGEKINNYVSLSTGLFRIVKVTKDNKLLLIPAFEKYMTHVWDDRYNSDKKYNTGFNTYKVSRVRDYLEQVYNNKEKDLILLSKKEQEKLSPFSLCIGKREGSEANNSGDVECTDQLENQMIGLLTAADYLTASLDGNCHTTMDRACQNYNYLGSSSIDWWLVTGNSANSSEVYYVNSSGFINKANASSSKKIRPTIMLNNNVMIKSGAGTRAKPYILK